MSGKLHLKLDDLICMKTGGPIRMADLDKCI